MCLLSGQCPRSGASSAPTCARVEPATSSRSSRRVLMSDSGSAHGAGARDAWAATAQTTFFAAVGRDPVTKRRPKARCRARAWRERAGTLPPLTNKPRSIALTRFRTSSVGGDGPASGAFWSQVLVEPQSCPAPWNVARPVNVAGLCTVAGTSVMRRHRIPAIFRGPRRRAWSSSPMRSATAGRRERSRPPARTTGIWRRLVT